MIELFMFKGTGAPKGGDSICKQFTNALDKSKFKVTYVEYPATYGPTISYGVSRTKGVSEGLRLIAESPYPAAVGGFSQGADVAGIIADMIGSGVPGTEQLELLAAYLIADPCRAKGSAVLNGNVGGYGIAGSRRVRGVPMYQVANPGDPISAYPEGPLRGVADFTAYASTDLGAWAGDVTRKIALKQLQPWYTPDHWRDWAGTAGWVSNYFSGFHTDQYYHKGLPLLLANEANKLKG